MNHENSPTGKSTCPWVLMQKWSQVIEGQHSAASEKIFKIVLFMPPRGIDIDLSCALDRQFGEPVEGFIGNGKKACLHRHSLAEVVVP